MKHKLKVIKIGGNIINNPSALEDFLTDFADIKTSKILIHGGGVLATELSKKMGIEPKFEAGRRVTTAKDLEIVTMVYGGLLNKQIVAKLQSKDCNALGLTGADAGSVLATKRPVIPIDYGYVGNVEKVNSKVLAHFLKAAITPVFCALTHDGHGQLFNTNADTMAAEIASAMNNDYETELIYCFEKKGVLQDVDDDNSVIEAINHDKYLELKSSGVIDAGMLPKLENCFNALNNKVSKVVIANASILKNENELCTTLTL